METVALRHWQDFVRFCQYEREAGGPDPHMRTMEWIARQATSDPQELAWAAGLYAGVYNVPTAHMLMEDFGGYEVALQLSTDQIAAYLQRRWKGIDFRRERRAVRSPEKLARYLRDYASFVEAERWTEWATYEDGWDAVTAVYSVGRYAALKLLEALHRFLWVPDHPEPFPGQSDMRAPGGWSPRECLALLFPQFHDLLKSETAQSYAITDSLGEQISERMGLSMYDTQVLLCDFKQSAITRRQYPGKSLDSELGYARKVYPWWEIELGRPVLDTLLEARLALFQPRYLGEVNGWMPEDRKPLGNVLAAYGYTWSDRLYDWHSSVGNLAQPVRWGGS